MRGMARSGVKKPFSLIHFDAHPDIQRDRRQPRQLCHHFPPGYRGGVSRP
ncbi:hypothetical protein EOA78_00825 [Mesorhizobium sp. M5C.F.Cr.IN.023.01.1.1]|nr:hypothetical protein EOA78_00825 [Mesorhizobium sp. M5C.F.Cr.IN.023.01.1.1]